MCVCVCVCVCVCTCVYAWEKETERIKSVPPGLLRTVSDSSRVNGLLEEPVKLGWVESTEFLVWAGGVKETPVRMEVNT